MEKDEKIRQVQSQRTRTLGILSLAALAAMLVVGFVFNNNNPTADSDAHHVEGSLRKPFSEKRQSHHQNRQRRDLDLTHVDKKTTLSDRRRAHLHQGDHHNDGATAARHETLGERRRHHHYAPEENVAVEQQPPEGEERAQQQEEAQQPDDEEEEESEEKLADRVAEYDKNVREVKKNVVANGGFMETDPQGVMAARALQEATRKLLKKRYGPREPYRVKVDLEFQPSNPTFATAGKTDSFTIELAPSSLVPHSIFTFLEVARHWPEKKGAFHRRANHVLQVLVAGRQVDHLAFQEYSPEFPHVKGTVGYAGRPSGPAWYVSIQNNAKNHGPGSQQAKNPHEADSCFGKVVEGFDRVVLGRITKIPGDGFVKKPLHVLISKMTILVPAGDDAPDSFIPWTAGSVATS